MTYQSEYDNEGDDGEMEQETPDLSAVASLAEKIAGVIGKEEMKPLAESAAKQVLNALEHELSRTVAHHVQKECGAQLTALADKLMAQELAKVVETEIVISGRNSWDQAKMTIRQSIEQSFKDAITALKSDRGEGAIRKMFDNFIDKEVGGMCSEALKEFKLELKKEFEQETMKKMVQGIASAIGSDKRLLAILQAS